MHTRRLIVLSILTLSTAGVSLGQDEKLFTPRPEHELLERLAGDWTFEKRSAPADGSKPENLGTGEVHAELLGGYFVVSRWSGKLYGGDYKAVQTLGYEPDRAAYTGIWIDSSMNYQWKLDGSLETESKELVLEATGPGPGGGMQRYRDRYRFDSNDSTTIAAQSLEGEKWVTFMTTHLTRKKGANPAPPAH